MSRTVSRVIIAANEANHRSMMALWQFCSGLFAINSNNDYKVGDYDDDEP